MNNAPTDPHPRRGSMILRMTAWYAGSSFGLILIVTGLLYGSVAAKMRAEDHRILRDTAADIAHVLGGVPAAAGAQSVKADLLPRFRHPVIWVRLIGPDGRVRMQTRGMARLLPIADFPRLLALPAGRRTIEPMQTKSGALFDVLTMRAAGADFALLQVAIDRTADQKLLVSYRERLLVVLLLALLACSGIGFAIAAAGFRPVAKIAKAAGAIQSSNLHERLDDAGLPAELDSLARSFNVMLGRLEASFRQVSQFSADVAHELRTPVNNLRGEIEVALGRPRSEAEYREVLASALEECARLSRVIHSLLFLARAENAGEVPRLEMLDIRAELERISEFYEPMAAEAGVVLVMEVSGTLTAELDRTLLQQAVGNLLGNAIAHTPGGGRISLWAGRKGDEMAEIVVSDTGRGIPAAGLPHVFERFYRADPARGGTGGNSGLGLSVVRSIAALHGGSVSIVSEAGKGTTVTLLFPFRRREPAPGDF